MGEAAAVVRCVRGESGREVRDDPDAWAPRVSGREGGSGCAGWFSRLGRSAGWVCPVRLFLFFVLFLFFFFFSFLF